MQTSPLPALRCLPRNARLRYSPNTSLFRRYANGTRQPGSNSNPAAKARRRQRIASLFEELFPREVARSNAIASAAKAATERAAAREIPRLDIGVDVPVDSSLLGASSNTPGNKLQWGDKVIHALRLKRASKHLTMDDFKRVLPSSRHVQGWVSQGNILKVIKGRDKDTLVPNGEYYILFDSYNNAVAYQKHALHLHKLTRTHTPSPQGMMLVPPAPPLRGVDQGDQFDATLSYTLTLPSQTLDLKLLAPPFVPVTYDLVQRGGYGKLMDYRRSEHEVLITVENYSPTLAQVEKAMFNDGAARGMQWLTVGERRGLRAQKIPLQVMREEFTDRGEDHIGAVQWDDRAWPEQVCFIVSFENEPEARRFVMFWHRRDIGDLLGKGVPADALPIVNAEYIW